MTKSNKSLPRGRRRLGWKTEFLDALGDAAVDLGDLTEKEAVQSVRSQRSARGVDRRTEVWLRKQKWKV